MNIKDFLIDNYIWIIVIILITIITIIGFIADKNKNKKEKAIKVEVTNDENSSIPVNDVTKQGLNNGQEQVSNSNDTILGMNLGNMDTTINPIGKINEPTDVNVQAENSNSVETQMPGIQMNNDMTNIQPMNNQSTIENIIPQAIPQPIQDPSTNLNAPPVTNFDDVVAKTTLTSPLENQFNLNVPNNTPSMVQNNFGASLNTNMNMQPNNVNQMAQQPQMNVQPNQMFNQTPNNNGFNPMGQQMGNGNVNGMNTFNQNNTTIPTPVNPIPTPQPVTPQPIMSGLNNNQNMMQPNYVNQMAQQPQMNSQAIPSAPTQPMQSQTPISGAPVNFVFGPQDNNQNM